MLDKLFYQTQIQNRETGYAMPHPKLYHLIVLLCCAAIGLIQGIHDLIHHPLNSRLHSRLERNVERLLAMGFLFFCALILLQPVWAIDGLIFCFAISIIDCLSTIPSEFNLLAKRLKLSTLKMLWTVFVLLVQGVPIGLLIWLRHIFTAN
jgi:hypothetical protein